jgi:hypothetical protein
MMDIGDKEVVAGIGATIFGWLGGVWSVARKVGKFEEKTEMRLGEHDKQIAENAADIEAIKKEYKEDLASIRGFFSTTSGGQKFMTFPDHDVICGRNTKAVVSEIQHIADAVKGLATQSAEMGKQVSQIATEVAVIKAELKK